jgi:negative regulator of flagellin synthesis FlgM
VKIDDGMKKAGGLPVSSTQTRAGKGADKSGGVGKPVTSTPPSTSDNVHLSSQVQALAGQLASDGVFDTNKVEEIKSAIASGTFQVDPEKVANGLLDTVKDLIHSRKA